MLLLVINRWLIVDNTALWSKKSCGSRLCLHKENCRGGTEVSVKITCGAEEKKTGQKRRLCGHCGNKIGAEEEWRKRMERSGHGGRDHVLTISGRRTHYG